MMVAMVDTMQPEDEHAIIVSIPDNREKSAKVKDERGRFLPGNRVGPGRPRGARNKISNDFLQALAEDFAENGADAIRTTRLTKPEVYVKIVADLVPKDVNVNHAGSEAFLQLWEMVSNKTQPKVIDITPEKPVEDTAEDTNA